MLPSETAYLPVNNSQEMEGLGFENASVRRLFVRKVYAILTLQLLVTGVLIFAFQMSDSLQNLVLRRALISDSNLILANHIRVKNSEFPEKHTWLV